MSVGADIYDFEIGLVGLSLNLVMISFSPVAKKTSCLINNYKVIYFISYIDRN